MATGYDGREGLTGQARERLAALRDAGSLHDLVELTGAGSAHDAYFEAKDEWFDLRGRELAAAERDDLALPGNSVAVDGTVFHVHGVTHAETPEERAYLREHVDRFLADGDSVYCEQGVRPMYFDDVTEVNEMDDYRWAMAKCERLEDESRAGDLGESDFAGVADDLDDLATRFRDAAFAIADSGSDVDPDSVRNALGDVASALFTSHEDLATGEDYASFVKSRRASRNPECLGDLQDYYERRFLPQPVEREWLRRHDPEVELVTHARNERMADYAVYHAADESDIHLIVGAAHQPGVTYYLEQFRDGERRLDEFELVG